MLRGIVNPVKNGVDVKVILQSFSERASIESSPYNSSSYIFVEADFASHERGILHKVVRNGKDRRVLWQKTYCILELI